MAWHRIGDKPLSESITTRFTDAYVALGGDELIKYLWLTKEKQEDHSGLIILLLFNKINHNEYNFALLFHWHSCVINPVELHEKYQP